MSRITIHDLLATARRTLVRMDPVEAHVAAARGDALIDIRGDWQIARGGTVPGAVIIARNVLEWRLDPSSGHAHPEAPQLVDRVILLCDEGYQSSLAAATLQHIGFARATDVIGGFRAWRHAQLPIVNRRWRVGTPVAPAICRR